MLTQIKSAYAGNYYDEDAVWLEWNQYKAAILPKIGANLVAFRDTERELTILREPKEEEMDQFRANPVVYGIPVLFPPNRFQDGTFTWQGRKYQFPINEERTGNHLHGFFLTTPWTIEEFGTTSTESYVVCSITIDEEHEIFQYLPHHFTLRLRYSLNEQGLLQHTMVMNHGKEAMPCMIAFHTTINTPFAAESSHEDYTFTMTIGERFELNERQLPTGSKLELSQGEMAMQTSGVSPFWEAMDNHYTSTTKDGRNKMELTDHRLGVKLVYDAGAAFKHWMIWNNNKTPGFFCPEPQLNLVNAPNVDFPHEDMGLVSLEPGCIWEETSRLYIV